MLYLPKNIFHYSPRNRFKKALNLFPLINIRIQKGKRLLLISIYGTCISIFTTTITLDTSLGLYTSVTIASTFFPVSGNEDNQKKSGTAEGSSQQMKRTIEEDSGENVSANTVETSCSK